MHRAGQQDEHHRSLASRLGNASQLLCQASTLDEFHGEKWKAVQIAYIMHLDNIRMRQSRHGLRLAYEAGQFI